MDGESPESRTRADRETTPGDQAELVVPLFTPITVSEWLGLPAFLMVVSAAIFGWLLVHGLEQGLSATGWAYLGLSLVTFAYAIVLAIVGEQAYSRITDDATDRYRRVGYGGALILSAVFLVVGALAATPLVVAFGAIISTALMTQQLTTRDGVLPAAPSVRKRARMVAIVCGAFALVVAIVYVLLALAGVGDVDAAAVSVTCGILGLVLMTVGLVGIRREKMRAVRTDIQESQPPIV